MSLGTMRQLGTQGHGTLLRSVMAAHRQPTMATPASLVQYRLASGRSRLPVNTIINFVPHRYEYIVERFGKFHKKCDSGINVLLPFFDHISYVQSMKEIAVEIPSQTAITTDNVTIHIDGVLYYKVVDSIKASYGVEDAKFAISQLAQTTMRSELGRMNLDTIFQERSQLNTAIVEAINHASNDWGIQCMRYEIRDISLPTKVKEAMQVQVEAERMKRARVLESEGIRQSKINVSEGEKQSRILQSEGQKLQDINLAEGQAKAMERMAVARASALESVAEAIVKKAGDRAASLSVAEQYVSAFKELAKTNNTLMLPSNTGDVASMVSQAMAIYGQMGKTPNAAGPSTPSSSTSSPPDTTSSGSSDSDSSNNTSSQKPRDESGLSATSSALPAVSRHLPRSSIGDPKSFHFQSDHYRQQDGAKQSRQQEQ
eukprot:scpid80305/ scgid19675/ Stomatin-like protein 2; EPB72-like protein 2